MGLGADLRRFRTKGMDNVHATVRLTVEEFGGRLATDWTPLGNPELWKSAPPADYRPGNLQSSWFLTIGTPSRERTNRTDIRAINGMDQLPDKPAGLRIFLANNADHAGAIEAGHSGQAPVGIMWAASEFSPMAAAIGRRIAG